MVLKLDFFSVIFTKAVSQIAVQLSLGNSHSLGDNKTPSDK